MTTATRYHMLRTPSCSLSARFSPWLFPLYRFTRRFEYNLSLSISYISTRALPPVLRPLSASLASPFSTSAMFTKTPLRLLRTRLKCSSSASPSRHCFTLRAFPCHFEAKFSSPPLPVVLRARLVSLPAPPSTSAIFRVNLPRVLQRRLYSPWSSLTVLCDTVCGVPRRLDATF